MEIQKLIDEIELYECPKCLKNYENEEEAISCCININSNSAYKCMKCKKIHDEKKEAYLCCNSLNDLKNHMDILNNLFSKIEKDTGVTYPKQDSFYKITCSTGYKLYNIRKEVKEISIILKN